MLIKDRYEITSVLARGGMGVVYRARDNLISRDVALKTIQDVPSTDFLNLFHRECAVLASLVHPNIVEIFDMGDFEENGCVKPYFVMPLLPGRSLYDLIYPSKLPLSASRCVDIISQCCRALQAAHDRKLLHRDIKPRNIFVMEDDAVKLIDFGIAQVVGKESTYVRGTPQYMSPEQISFKHISNQSDIFSLATVCYEALTAIQPFEAEARENGADDRIAAAVINYNPPLISEINPAVSRALAQVVAKGMAKEAWARHESAAAFAEALSKALRNGQSLAGPSASSALRLERARVAFQRKDYGFAFELVRQIEAEGQGDEQVAELRRELDQALRTEQTEKLLESARRFFDGEEYTLALRKIQEVLDSNPNHADAIALKKEVEEVLTEQKVAELLRAASEYMREAAFTNARQAAQDALKLKPDDQRAKNLLAQVESRQKDILRQRQDQERLFQLAQAAWLEGKIQSAVEILDSLDQLTRSPGDKRERVNEYKEFRRRIRAEFETLQAAITQARLRIAHSDIPGARKIYDRYAAKYPAETCIAELKADIATAEATRTAAERESALTKLNAETDLSRKIAILEEALKSAPQDEAFEQELSRIREQQRAVLNEEHSAAVTEQNGELEQALHHWERIRTVYPDHPGVEDNVRRLEEVLRAKRLERRGALLSHVRESIAAEDYAEAERALVEAEDDGFQDEEIADLLQHSRACLERHRVVSSLLAEGATLLQQHRFREAAACLGQASRLGAGSKTLSQMAATSSAQAARGIAPIDWQAALSMLEDLASVEGGVAVPEDVWAKVRAHERQSKVESISQRAAQAEQACDLHAARGLLLDGLHQYADERLLQSQLAAIDARLAEERAQAERAACLKRLGELRREWQQTDHPADVNRFVAALEALRGTLEQSPDLSSGGEQLQRDFGDYQNAAGLLEQDYVDEAQRICSQALARRSGQRPFEAIAALVECRRQELAARYFDETQERLTKEPDLSRRIAILAEATRLYPDEPRFAEDLAALREQQNRIVAMFRHAAALEEDGLYEKACEEWQRIEAVYPFHPDVQHSLVRCQRLWKENREQALALFVREIEAALNSQTYSSARSRLGLALADFPGNEALLALEHRLADIERRRDESKRLITQARAELAARRFEGCQELLLQALRTAEGQGDLTRAAANTLVDAARDAVDLDWQIAQSMLQHARHSTKTLPIPKDLQTRIASAARRHEIASGLQRVRETEQSGDIPAARRLLRELALRYPGERDLGDADRRLARLEEEVKAREQRSNDISRLERYEKTAAAGPEVRTFRDLLSRVGELASRYPADPEVSPRANTLRDLCGAVLDIVDLLERGELDEAQRICSAALTRHPGQTTLESLHAAIATQVAERAAEYVRQIELKLEGEPDFRKQRLILEEALRAYPAEPYFQTEIELVAGKETLLASAIGRARNLEAKGLYEDALREFETSSQMYPWMPELRSDVERLSAILTQRRAEIRNAWADRIDAALKSPHQDAAEQLLTEAEAEFPDDPVFATRRRELDTLRSRRRQAAESLHSAERLFEENRHSEAITELSKCAELDTPPFALRGAAASLLFTHANKRAHDDWQLSLKLLKQLSSLDPGFPVPPELSAHLAEQSQAAERRQLVSQISSAQSQGDLRKAEDYLKTAFARFPGDAELTAIEANLRASIQELERKRLHEAATRQLEEIRHQLKRTTKRNRLIALRDSIPQPLLHSNDQDICALATGLSREITERIDSLNRVAPKPVVRAPLDPRLRIVALLAAGLAVALAIVAAWFIRRPQLVSVEFHVQPAGTAVKIGDYSCLSPHCRVRLAAGMYKVLLSKPGYRPLSIPLRIAATADKAQQFDATLVPVTPVFRMVSDVASATVALDGGPPAPVPGEFTLAELDPGDHSVRITGDDGGTAVVRFTLSDTGPVLTRVSGDKLRAVAVSHTSSSARIATNLPDGPVLVDGRSQGLLSRGLLNLARLAPGEHSIEVGSAPETIRFTVPVSSEGAVYASLAGTADVGTLVLSSNLSNVDAFVNGVQHRLTTPSTRIRLPSGHYKVVARRDGYVPSDAVDIVVTRASESRIDLRLTPKPGTLEIAGLQAGTEIRIDGRAAGRALSTGTFLRDLTPGDHTLDLARTGFNSKQLQFHVDPAQKVSLSGADVTLTPAAPDLADAEATQWRNASTSPTIEKVEEYLRNNPAGTHAESARAKIRELRWDALNKDDAGALRSYLANHPEEPWASQARARLDNIATADAAKAEQAQEASEWAALDKTNEQALQAFILKFPSGSHASAAAQMRDQLLKAGDQEQRAWNALNHRDASSIRAFASRFPSGKHQAQAQQELSVLEKDQAAIAGVVRDYAAAWNARSLPDILRLQPGADRKTLKPELSAARSIDMQLTCLAPSAVDSSQATVSCRRAVTETFADGKTIENPAALVRIVLARRGASWIIESIGAAGAN